MNIKEAEKVISDFNHRYSYGSSDCVLVTKLKKTCNNDLKLVASILNDLTSTCRECFNTDYNEHTICYSCIDELD